MRAVIRKLTPERITAIQRKFDRIAEIAESIQDVDDRGLELPWYIDVSHITSAALHGYNLATERLTNA